MQGLLWILSPFHNKFNNTGVWMLGLFSSFYTEIINELCALRGFFGPPMRIKYKNCFLPISSCKCIRIIAKVYKSRMILTVIVAMVAIMAIKIG